MKTHKLFVVGVACAAVSVFGEVDPSGRLTHAAYVQDGLAQLFDAIDNEGTGTHNPSATVWRDLKGSTSVTLTSPAEWGEKWLATKSTRQTLSGIPDFYYDDVTTEVAINVITNYSSYPRIFVHNRGDGVWSIYYTGSGLAPEIYANTSGTRPSFTAFRNGTISLIGDATGIYGYNNGLTRTSQTVASPGHTLVASSSVYLSGNSGTLDGYYRSFRHYTRALTADEVKHNVAVDGLRYFSFGYTGSGTATPVAWGDVAWTAPYAATTAAPSDATVDYVQLVNAKVSVADGQVMLRGLSLEANATLSIPAGAKAWAKVLYVGGTEIPRGIYTGSGALGTQVAWLEGAGSLHVAGSIAGEFQDQVLKARADGTAGTFLAASVDDQLDEPDYTTGSPVDLSQPYGYYSLLLQNGYTFPSSDTAFHLNAGGLRAVDAAAATTYTVNFPIQTTAAQTWYLGTNTTVDLTRPLDARAALTITGKGRLNLRQPGTGSATVTVAGCADPDATQRAGAATKIYCYTNDVFGSALAKLDVLHSQLVLEGNFTQTVPLETSCSKNDWDYPVFFKGNLTFNATFEHKGNNVRPIFYRGRRVVFNKTFKTGSSAYCEARSDFSSTAIAEVVCNDKLFISDRFNVPAGMYLYLNVPTNRINGNRGTITGKIICGCERALEYQNGSNNGTYFFSASSGVLDLGGYDQGLGCIYNTSNGGTITSERPATLHLVDNYKIPNYDSQQKDAQGNNISAEGYTNYVVFAGCASLSKEGTYTNRLKRVSTTYGDLTVLKSRLEFAPEATWLNASNLWVKGTGTFALDNRTAQQGQPFGKHIDVHVEGETAKIELNNAIPAKVHELYFDGRCQTVGCYWGSEDAKNAHPSFKVKTAPCFTGTGLIYVRGDNRTMMFVR